MLRNRPRLQPGRGAPPACVMGEVDLVRALALAGIRSAVFAPPGNPARYARSVAERLDWAHPRHHADDVLQLLLDFAGRWPEPPVLFYDGDWDLLLVSRERERLGAAFRFVIPDAELVEALTDKERFARLAEELGLPVPPARRLREDAVPEAFPVVVKPLTRDHSRWKAVATGGKAIWVADPASFRATAANLAAAGVEALVQPVVAGPESSIVSYHVYVDAAGEIAAEFTGRKLRTYPERFGYTTALTVTELADVRELGRDIVARLGLRGVAKLDFKRAPDSVLHLLEVNARFNLWHHPGALAGSNIPAIVHADLTGSPRPRPVARMADVRWCSPRHDALAARDDGIGPLAWLGWLARCEAVSGFAWDDPLPLPRALAHRTADALRPARR